MSKAGRFNIIGAFVVRVKPKAVPEGTVALDELGEGVVRSQASEEKKKDDADNEDEEEERAEDESGATVVVEDESDIEEAFTEFEVNNDIINEAKMRRVNPENPDAHMSKARG